MSVDRHIWSTGITEDNVPPYPCPRCRKGHLTFNPDSFSIVEPAHSLRQHSDDDFEPEWVEERFTMLLICSNITCGEVVAVAGTAGVFHLEYFDEHSGHHDGGYQRNLYPKSMYPAPPLFPISAKIPKTVQAQLKLAFQLFWTDLSASTSRLRTSLEFVLDDQEIPKVTKNQNNEDVRLNLQARIDKYEAKYGNADNAESMKALRIVGNLGTHGDEVDRDRYFDLLDVYEVALLEIYEKTSEILKAKKVALIALQK